jgi:type I restriction enzyme S subunit
MQSERDAGGSVIAHWKPEQIKNLLIPLLPQPTQQKIADLVKKAHEARRKAKSLLEEAKKKVEKMIENSHPLYRLSKNNSIMDYYIEWKYGTMRLR